jgi:hypothetical protein
MKKLILAFATLISITSFSQVITVTWNRTKAFNFHGNTARIPEFAAAGNLVFDVTGNGKKEIDLEKMEMRFSEDNILKHTLKIKSYQKTSNTRIEIILVDYDLRTSKPFDTYQIIDFKTKTSYYSWYYDGSDDMTWVCIEAGGKIEIK